MSRRHRLRKLGTAICWERVRAIFDDPQPPTMVWESQFDDFQEDLERLAKTPYEQIDFVDLWYYHHDLAFVDLQPDLFAYLFPVCLMDWHASLQKNETCAHGDSEFHYGIWRGNVFEKMLTPEQLSEVFAFFRDSFLLRLDAERGFVYDGMHTPAYGWMSRLNSLAIIMPCIDMIWSPWWAAETPGRAVCVVQYCSGLIYAAGENPLFDPWTQESGGGGPYLWGNDSHIYDQGWLEVNLDYVVPLLAHERMLERLEQAVVTLQGEPEEALAKEVLRDATLHRTRMERRLAELPALLRKHNVLDDWAC